MTLKVLSLFSGIGAFEKALTNLGIEFEVVNYCEIDKYASRAYSAIHNIDESKNLWDVTKIDTSKFTDIDLITYGFPCQDISIAGRQAGFKNDRGKVTRSGLFFEALRIIRDIKPKYAIAENVKALVSRKFKQEFTTIIESLNECGYNNYYDALNAKDYGIPQQRERVFIISVNKNIDDLSFNFPSKQKLNKYLNDFLDDDVDKKYFLSDELKNYFINNSLDQEEKGNGFRFVVTNGNKSIARCLSTCSGSRMDDNFISNNIPADTMRFDKKSMEQFEK